MAKIKENNKWIKTTNRFVAFFDIMGFKDLVSKKSHDEIVSLLETLSKSRTDLEELNNHQLDKSLAIIGETKSFTFSDSIIFFSKGDQIEDLNKIILDCLYIVKKSIESQIPIKGALSFGNITLDIEKSIYFGQPIIDAYTLHEDLLLYSVIADHNFEKRTKELKVGTLSKLFSFYKTPMKYGKTTHYILKPTYVDKDLMLEGLQNLYVSVSGKPRQYIDNTIDFII